MYPGTSLGCSLTLSITLLAGCARPPTATALPAPAPGRAADAGLELYHSLIADFEAYHVFAPATVENLGFSWADTHPALRRAFTEAETDAGFARAADLFATSLHNPHSYFVPAREWDFVSLPLTLEVEWVEGSVQFYLAETWAPNLQETLQPGDLLVEADGVAASALLEHYAVWSNSNNWRGIAHKTTKALTTRRLYQTEFRAGSTSNWIFQRREGGETIAVDLTWEDGRSRPPRSLTNEQKNNIDYGSQQCAGLPEREYGPYQLVTAGIGWCLYASHQAPYDAFPIVRQFSFYYTDLHPSMARAFHYVRTDHALLVAALQALPTAEAVLLDLRDNKGGNSPRWFLDWWASRPYRGLWVSFRLHQDFLDDDLRATHFSGDSEIRYLKALRNAAADQRFTQAKAFGCRGDCIDADDNLFTPTHQVTDAAVALIVGPGCVSACDSVAHAFAQNKLGPVVGEPTASAFTVKRLKWAVQLSGEEPVGHIYLAFSEERATTDGPSVEAVPIALDRLVERTWAEQGTWDRRLVEAAIDATRAFVPSNR